MKVLSLCKSEEKKMEVYPFTFKVLFFKQNWKLKANYCDVHEKEARKS